MKKVLIVGIILFSFTGCLYFNERGISAHRYNDCKEYYDSMGIYHKKCEKNLLEYDNVKRLTD